MIVQTLRTQTQPASELINIDSYQNGSNLIITKGIGDILTVGRIYEMSPLSGGGTEFNDVIHNIAKTSPENAVIQVSLFSYPDHDASETYLKNKDFGGDLIQALVGRKSSLIKESLSIGWQPDIPPLNIRKVIISTQIPISSVDEKTLEIEYTREEQFFTNLRNSGFIDARVLDVSEAVGLYRQFFNIFKPRPRNIKLDPTLDFKYQIFAGDTTLDFRDPDYGLINNDTYVTCVTQKSYPEKPFHGLMNLVSGAPFNTGTAREGGGQRILNPFIINTTIQIANQRQELRRIEDAISSRKATQKFPIKLGNEDSQKKYDDLQLIKTQAAVEGNKICFVSTHGFFFGNTPGQAKNGANTFKNMLEKLDFDSRIVRLNILPRFMQAMPLNFSVKLADKIKGRATMCAAAAGYLLPVYGDFLGNVSRRNEQTGSIYYTRRGQAHYWDPFVSETHFSGVVAAEPGAGKSFWLQDFITSHLAMGRNVYLIDNGKSAKKYAIANQEISEYNEFGEDGGYQPSLNPFSGLTQEEFNFQRDGITSLLMLMAFEDDAPTEGAKIAMQEAVTAAFNANNEDTEIDHVIEALRNVVRSQQDNSRPDMVARAAVDLVPRLNAFIASPNRRKYFIGKSTIEPKKQLTVFEIGTLGDDLHLKKCVLFFILNTLQNRTKNIPGKKLIIADEAHDLIDDPASASVFESLYLKARKDGGSIWLILQSILKLAETPYGRTIFNQSAWKVVLQQPTEEIEKVLKEGVISSFKSDPFFSKQLLSVRSNKGVFSEMQIIGRNTYEVVRLYVDSWTATLYGSEGEAREKIFDLMRKGMSPVDAVSSLLNDKITLSQTWVKRMVAQLHESYEMNAQDILQAVKKGLGITNDE